MLTENLFKQTRISRQHKSFIVLLMACFFSSQILQARQSGSVAAVKSTFTARLMNIEAATNEPFRYNTSLYSNAKQDRVYELKADLPPGWMISYRVDGSQVRSLRMAAGKTQDISVEINASQSAKPATYKIPIRAVSNADTLLLQLEAVVKGSYTLALNTPTGRLSEEVTSGSHRELQLIVKNEGTLALNDLELSSQLPAKWESTFEPSQIKQLEPGKTIDVKVTLKVPDKTIAGDYATTFIAKNANSNAQVAFRMIVTTSVLAGWIGIVVILLSIAVVYFLIRKYGRR